MTKRIREIDLLRAIAIVLMIIFHSIVDLTDFFKADFNYMSGFWYFEGKLSAILFILVSGISSTLGRHHVKRAFLVLGAGFIIIASTYLFNPATYVRFGILQLIGCSMLSYSLIYKLSPLVISLIALSILIITQLLPSYVSFPYLLPFGIMPFFFTSIDYYPLFPWYGVFLGGVVLGKILYAKKQSLFPNLPDTRLLRLFEQAGQHSLIIYLVHQPILLTALYALHWFLS